MPHKPPEPFRMIRTNRRFKVLWRQQENLRDVWAFRSEKGDYTEKKSLEDWLNAFLKDKKHTHGIIIATTEFIVLEVHDVKLLKKPVK